MRKLLTGLLLIVVLAAGCTRATPAPAPTPVATAAASPTVTAPAPATATAPLAQPAATAVAQPTAAGQPTASTSTAAPAWPNANWGDWSAYQSALRPAAGQGLNLQGMTEYHMNLQLTGALDRLDGAERVRYTNRAGVALDRLYLHLFPNLWNAGETVSEVQVNGQPVKVQLEGEGALLNVPLDQPLLPGQVVELAIRWTVPIPKDRDVGNYGDFAYQQGILALAGFYPTMVVYDTQWHLEKPSEQGDVLFNQASLYDVTLTAPSGLIVAATGTTAGKQDLGNGSTAWRLVGGPMRDFNITGSEQFTSANRQVADVTVNSYFLPQDRQSGNDALGWAANALQDFERDFGPYPYRELDVVETSTSAGGIEYPGLVVIASELYSNAQERAFFEGATAHEVAHQWWYNVVGDDQLNTPWLDESTAQYATYLYYQTQYGASGAQGFKASLEGRWQRVNNETKPIGLPVTSYSDQEYGAIVYGRGPLFLIDLQNKVGQPAMLKFLQQYYKQYAWQIATPADFLNTLQQTSGQNLGADFNSVVYGK